MNHLEVNFNLTNNYKNHLSVELIGTLNTMNANNFKKDLLRLLSVENLDCTVNIENLDAIDLTGLNALVTAHKTLQMDGRELTVVCKEENPISELLQLTKFNRYLNLKRA